MAELRSAIFWVLCPKQSLHCYIYSIISQVCIFKHKYFLVYLIVCFLEKF
ncbi:MAG: hypothetical protein IM580_04810 [Pseudanabaena sp. M090S1SP2A07QC]|nr:hypothetical protein [Pseudanabaena sp. M090S1SP2A07QC]